MRNDSPKTWERTQVGHSSPTPWRRSVRAVFTAFDSKRRPNQQVFFGSHFIFLSFFSNLSRGPD